MRKLAEKCDYPGCNRPVTRHWGELADMWTCEGHYIIMQSNGDSWTIPEGEVEARGPIFMRWAEDRKRGRDWLRANPNPNRQVSESDNGEE